MSLSMPPSEAAAQNLASAGVAQGPCLYIGGQFEVVDATHIRNFAQLCFDKNDSDGILDAVASVGDGTVGKVLHVLQGEEFWRVPS